MQLSLPGKTKQQGLLCGSLLLVRMWVEVLVVCMGVGGGIGWAPGSSRQEAEKTGALLSYGQVH